ncbi:substrate-binding domain-containing protein [Agromyces italicus]|uniref:substrate-binding domain-containing protein n=1 Tax=Agromyces italicus TaxID=279572 RepID=UPI0003F4BF1E|nr:substrate-binding domain-containing protein [Agromyces italicus]
MSATVALVGVAGVAGVAWASGEFERWQNPEIPCTTPAELSVVADPAIAATVKAIAADYDAGEQSCSRTEVTAQASADTAAMLASGNAADVDAWIPDSPVWLVRMSSTARSLGRPVPNFALERSIASSPVVFAAAAERAGELGDTPPGWNALMKGEFTALLADPEASSASLSALQAMERRADIGAPRQFQTAMIELNDTVLPTAADAFAELDSRPAGTFAIASEQQIALHNGETGSSPLVALYPSDGTLALNYPFLRSLDETELAKNLPAPGAEDAPDTAESRALALRAKELDGLKLALWGAKDAFAADGFRDGVGSGELEQEGILAEAVAVDTAAAGAQVSILRTWGVLSLRSRILSVVDVSGSMEEPTVTGLRRIDLLTQATTSTLSQFSGDVDLGLWIFSTERAGERDWESLAPIERLGDAEHKAKLGTAIASLPGRLGGATGLYDTALAAVAHVRSTYDTGKVNSVLLLTDGRNEDENGISLDQLLAQLTEMDDPAQPVPVIMVGIGPDTDVKAMRAIAKATGGAAYSAAEPRDLSVVLTDALSQRACRPNC